MDAPVVQTHALNLYYGTFHALIDVELSIKPHRVTALIGPSGCGKSTLLRTFNRMNDLVEGARVTGQVLVGGQDIYAPDTDVVTLRKQVGMVFQRPNPFPLSVRDNILFGPSIHRTRREEADDEILQRTLQGVMLWDDLKDALGRTAMSLTLEQQQRLCIARLLAVTPEVLLMDEPCSALDPASTERIEELIHELKSAYTIIIVTHNMKQAARISDECGFMLLGELVEFGETGRLFTNPTDQRTDDYIAGRYG